MAPSEYDATGDEKSLPRDAITLGLTFTTDKYGNTWAIRESYKDGKSTMRYKTRIGEIVTSPLKFTSVGIDAYPKDNPLSKSAWVPIPKPPKKLSLWVKILMILGLMTVKKHNEESLYNKDSKDKSSNSTASN